MTSGQTHYPGPFRVLIIMTESSPLPRAIQSADCNGTGGKWANLCSLGDYCIVSLSWRLIVGSLPPVSPSGISFSVLLAIIHHKKEGYSFGPKPRSSIICTRFPPAGFHSHLLLERRRPYGQTELHGGPGKHMQEVHPRKETALGRN